MFCQKCGSKVEQGVKFCSSCGNSLTNQKEAVPHEVVEVEIPIVSEPKTVAVKQMAASSIGVEKSGPTINIQKIIKNKLVLLPVAVAAIALILFIGIKLLPFSSSSDHTILYTKENQLFVKNQKMENSYLATKRVVDERIVDKGYYSTEEFYTYRMEDLVKKNNSGSRIFYMDNVDDDWTGALYYIESSNLKGAAGEQDKSVRIASNVSIEHGVPYMITDKGDQVLYIKDYDYRTGGKLYLHNLKEEVLIDKNVRWLYALSENNNLLMYVKTVDDGETVDLYIKDIKADKEKEKLESDIYSVVKHTPNFDKIYFTKAGSSESEDNNISLYVKETGKDNVKLISDFAWLEASDVDGTFMFTRTTNTEISLYDLVEDDMLKEDEKISKPQRSDYEYVVEDTDWWGDTYSYTEVDYEAYYEALDVYREKEYRDELRSELKYETVNNFTTSLFIYANGEEKKWVDAVGHGLFNHAKSQIAVYTKKKDNPINKRKLSTLDSYYDVKTDYWDSFEYSKEIYVMINGVETELLYNDRLYTRNFTLSKDGKKLYWIEGEVDRDDGALVSWDITGNKLENRKDIDDHVYKYVLVGESIWYYKGVKNYRGDLFTYSKGNKTEISYDVLVDGSMIYEDENTVLFITDFSENRLLGTLNLSNGKDKVKIADDVNSYYYWDRNNIYYITDYKTRNSKGDLWEYHGENKKKLLDDSVNYVVPLKTGTRF